MPTSASTPHAIGTQLLSRRGIERDEHPHAAARGGDAELLAGDADRAVDHHEGADDAGPDDHEVALEIGRGHRAGDREEHHRGHRRLAIHQREREVGGHGAEAAPTSATPM